MKPKNSKISKHKEKEVDYINFLIHNADSIDIPDNILIDELLNEVKSELENKTELDSIILKFNELHILEYSTTAPLLSKLGIGNHFVLFMVKNGNSLNFNIKSINWFKKLKTSKYSLNDFLESSHSQDIFNALNKIIRKYYGEITDIVDFNNFHVKELAPKVEMNFYNNLQKDEILLAAYEIEDFKWDEEEKTDDNKTKFLMISNQRQFIISDELEIIQTSDRMAFEKKTEIGRNRIVWANGSFLPTKKNKKQVEQILKIPTDSFEAIRYILAINKNNEDYPTKLHNQLIAQSKNPYDELILIARDSKIDVSEEETQKKIAEKIRLILESKKLRSYFSDWIKEWQIVDDEQFFIIQLFLDFTEETEALDDLLDVHSDIRTNFQKKNKNKYQQAFFDLGYCKHLIWSKKTDEAKKLIYQTIEKLPDESLWDLLPNEEEKLNEQSGQFLKINYLKLLHSIEGDKEKVYLARQLHSLQPLSTVIINSPNDISDKSLEIKKIIDGKLTIESLDYNPLYAVLSEKWQKQIEHPLSSKNKLFSNLQAWLVEKDKSDHSIIKKYAEIFDSEKYTEQAKVLNNLAEFYELKDLDAFVIYGEKSNDITAFEDKKAFITIGKQYLSKDSPLFLSNNEFAFALSAELSNLYFKSTHITSNDVWKGASKKGLFLVDALLSVIPAAGFLSSTFKNIQKIDQLSGIISRIQKVGDLSKTGINVLQNVNKLTKRSKEESNTNNEILLSSRLLQINSDRLGLLASGDILSAFTALLKQHQNYEILSERIKENGLISLLNEKNEKSSLKHKDFAIRIANLFSFYLSDEYDDLYKKLHQKPDELPPVYFK